MKADFLPVHVSDSIRRDLAEILYIEEKSSQCPWDENKFLLCRSVNNRFIFAAKGLASPWDEKVVGFMVYELCADEKRPWIRQFHILNFAVHPDCRRRGVGTQMIKALTCKLFLECYADTLITIEVRESNLDAQRFLGKMNFLAMRVMREFYTDSSEDAYVMEYYPLP